MTIVRRFRTTAPAPPVPSTRLTLADYRRSRQLLPPRCRSPSASRQAYSQRYARIRTADSLGNTIDGPALFQRTLLGSLLASSIDTPRTLKGMAQVFCVLQVR